MKNIRLALSLVILFSFGALFVLSAATSSASTPIVTFARDLDGSLMGQTVVGIGGKPLPPLTAGALSYDGGSWYFGASSGVAPGISGQALWTNDAGTATTWVYPHGDVDASATDPGALTVNAIQGIGVSTTVPSSTNVLAYSSGLWRPTAFSTANMTPGTAGQVFVSNGTPAAAWTSLIKHDTTHGTFTIGGSGSDYKSIIGPMSAAETTDATLHLLANGESSTNSNFALDYGAACQALALHAGSVCFNARGAGGTYGDVVFTNANGTAGTLERLGYFDGVSGNLVPLFQIQWLTNGTIVAGGTMTVTAGSNMLLNATGGYINSTAPDFYADETTLHLRSAGHTEYLAITPGATTTIRGDATSTTSVVVGPNKAGATLVLQGDAATTIQTISASGTDHAQIAAPAAPSIGAVRVYVDSADNKLKAKDPSGNVFVLAP